MTNKGMALVVVLALIVVFFGLGVVAFRSVTDTERLSKARMSAEMLKGLTPEALHILMNTLKAGFQNTITNYNFLGHAGTALPAMNSANGSETRPFEVAFSLPELSNGTLFNLGLKCKGPCRGLSSTGQPLVGGSHLDIGLMLSNPETGARRYSVQMLMKHQAMVGGFGLMGAPPAEPSVLLGGDGSEPNPNGQPMYLTGMEAQCALGKVKFEAWVEEKLAVPYCTGATLPSDVKPIRTVVKPVRLTTTTDLVAAKAETPLMFKVASRVRAAGESRTQFYVEDVNNDGKKDIVSVLGSGSPTRFYFNRGDYLEGKDFLKSSPTYQQDSAALRDFNGDGNMDVIAVSDVTNDVTVMEQKAAEQYGMSATLYEDTYSSPAQIYSQDFNLDGRQDIFFRAQDSNGNPVAVCALNSGGASVAFETPIVTALDRGITICEYFNLTPGSEARYGFACSANRGLSEKWSALYEVKKDCSFTKLFESETGNLVSGGASSYGVTAGDFNNDGVGDFVISEVGANSVVLYKGALRADQTTLSYSNSTICTRCTNGRFLAAEDIDSDGDLDIVASGTGAHFSNPSTRGHLRILINQGNATFRIQNVHVDGKDRDFSQIRVADMNNDGLKDIVAMSTDSPAAIYVLHQFEPESQVVANLFTGIPASIVGKVADTASRVTSTRPVITRVAVADAEAVGEAVAEAVAVAEGEAIAEEVLVPENQVNVTFATPAGASTISYEKVCGAQKTVSPQAPMTNVVNEWFAQFPYDKKVALCPDATLMCNIRMNPGAIEARGEGTKDWTEYKWEKGTVYVVNGLAVINESIYPASIDASVSFYAETIEFRGSVQMEGADFYTASSEKRMGALADLFLTKPRIAFIAWGEMYLNNKYSSALINKGNVLTAGNNPLVLMPAAKQPETIPGQTIQAHLITPGALTCMAQAMYETAPIEVTGTFAVEGGVEACYSMTADAGACRMVGSKVIVRPFITPESGEAAETPPSPNSNNLELKVISFRED